jgi:hypothetical protein
VAHRRKTAVIRRATYRVGVVARRLARHASAETFWRSPAMGFPIQRHCRANQISKMYLSIATTHAPATDLGFLLMQHPDRVHDVELSIGRGRCPRRATICWSASKTSLASFGTDSSTSLLARIGLRARRLESSGCSGYDQDPCFDRRVTRGAREE